MLKAAKIFQNGMILQREKTISVWGMGIPGAEVVVCIQESTGQAIVSENGNWSVKLPPLTASESETLVIRSGEEVLSFEDVAVGEVWLAGGQSNMEFQMRYEKHYRRGEIQKNNSRIRFFDVAEVCFDGQKDAFDYSAHEVWRSADKENVEYFSAVGYYFQSELEKVLDVPVGIIGCNWGGTRSCAWMNPETVEIVGKSWMEDYRNQIKDMDMEDYWMKQLANPMNDRGNLMNEFYEFMLPQTPSAEESMAYMEEHGMGPEQFGDSMTIMPQMIPGCLYEHMIKTVAPFGIRGFIWYQGENDDEEGKQTLYKDMLTGLISDWRELWQDKNLPFILAQLPGFESWLAVEPMHYDIIRQCQQAVAETVDHTYVCSISDAGEQFDIHPKNKKVVGHRMALLAQNYVYGQQVACEAPIFKSAERIDEQILIKFDYVYDGLQIGSAEAVSYGVVDQKLNTIANLKVFVVDEEVEYSAAVEGEKLIINVPNSSGNLLRVEFAGGDWFLVNLYNSAGIPAKPFSVHC